MSNLNLVGKRPAVVITLDFELRWGVHDHFGLNQNGYRANIEGARIVVPEILRQFEERQIRATWATVGALGCSDWNEYFSLAPPPPNYHIPNFRVNPSYSVMDPAGTLHFAPELVTAICNSPGQELATHTFSHIFMGEEGITSDDVSADLTVAIDFFRRRFGVSPVSLVFPRNQCGFQEAIRKCGIRIMRENSPHWYQTSYKRPVKRTVARCARILDSMNPFVLRTGPLRGDMLRLGLFVRFNVPDPLWNWQLSCIRKSLDRIGSGEIFCMTWHPHNLGIDIEKRLERLADLLDTIAIRRDNGNLVTLQMKDLISPIHTDEVKSRDLRPVLPL